MASLSKDDNCTPLLYVLRADAMGDFICSIATERKREMRHQQQIKHTLQQLNQCMTAKRRQSPEYCDTPSPHRQHKHRLRHPDGLELEATAEAESTVTEEGHRDDGSCKDVQRIHM